MVQRIRELCKNNGITIAELERRCGIGNGIIARWKKSTPSYERLSKVAEELGTTIEYLQTGEEQKEKPPAQGGELMEKYAMLSPENREAAQKYIDFLIAGQQNP